jgi:hypothetical protein
MSETEESGRIPLMAPDKAQEIARGLKWLAQSYEAAGMRRDSQRAEMDSQWWLAYSISLSQTPPVSKS